MAGRHNPAVTGSEWGDSEGTESVDSFEVSQENRSEMNGGKGKQVEQRSNLGKTS